MKLLNYKKIIFFTTNRSDFDHQKNIILRLQNNFKCYLVCGGQHFSKKDGYSFKKIQETKFRNLILLKNKKDLKININNIIKKIQPDFCCVFGDRLEMLEITLAIHSFTLPILHFCGGEVTSGSKDDGYRHSITKLSDYHIVTTDDHKKRVIQLGEVAANVFNVGSLTAENIQKKKKQKKEVIEKRLEIKLNLKNYLVTLHSDSLNNIRNYQIFFNSLKNVKNANFYITSPNQDYGSEKIFRIIKDFRKKKNFFYLKNLGQQNYIDLAFHMNAIIGNSSSGISEIPSIKVPTINIGKRQHGRPKSKSIINCDYKKIDILLGIKKADDKKFIKNLLKVKNPFFKKNALSTTVNIVKRLIKLKKPMKIFSDIPF